MLLSLSVLAMLFQSPTLDRVWSIRLQTEIQSYSIGEKLIFFGTNDSFGVIDQATGKKVWSKPVAMPQLGSHVAENEGVFFASVGQGNLSAFNSQTGKPIWTFRRTGYASPIGSYNRALYAEQDQGKLAAFSFEGKPIWSADLAKSTLSTKPIRFGKAIFAGVKSGSIFGFDKDTGKQIWKIKERNSAVQSLLVAEDRLIATYDDGSVLGLSLETGQRMWAVYTNNGLFGTPLVQSGRLYVTSLSGRFYSIAIQSGQELWVRSLSFRQNFGLSQPMAFRTGFLYADRSKLGFLNSDGEKQWEVNVIDDLGGQQPRPLGDDLLLTTSHGFMRYRVR